MKARYVYTVGIPETVLWGLSLVVLPGWLLLESIVRQVTQRSVSASPRWSGLILLGLVVITYALALYHARGMLRRASLELEGSQLTIHLGFGMFFLKNLGGPKLRGSVVLIDLEKCHLEWAGTALNLRDPSLGTITLADGSAAKPLAEWLTANGHTPVKVY